ncbi:response regulator [Palleronia sp.]|uniref:response regulator n=1 Tax=Palleronia sp. TaxID=1940284 RepID=UPI0035C8761F
MDDAPKINLNRRGTAQRPLLGQTILVIEDSRHAGETMRLMCLRGGARVRRADSVRSAERHLTSYRPSAVIVDLGLPDGSGLDLIGRLSREVPRLGVVIAVSGDPTLGDSALDAGADEFLAKPFGSVAAFQTAILHHLPAEALPQGPRIMHDERVEPDEAALHDDLAHVEDLLDYSAAPATLAYVAAFAYGLGRSIGDAEMAECASELSSALEDGRPQIPAVSALAGVVRTRMSGNIVAI